MYISLFFDRAITWLRLALTIFLGLLDVSSDWVFYVETLGWSLNAPLQQSLLAFCIIGSLLFIVVYFVGIGEMGEEKPRIKGTRIRKHVAEKDIFHRLYAVGCRSEFDLIDLWLLRNYKETGASLIGYLHDIPQIVISTIIAIVRLQISIIQIVSLSISVLSLFRAFYLTYRRAIQDEHILKLITTSYMCFKDKSHSLTKEQVLEYLENNRGKNLVRYVKNQKAKNTQKERELVKEIVLELTEICDIRQVDMVKYFQYLYSSASGSEIIEI